MARTQLNTRDLRIPLTVLTTEVLRAKLAEHDEALDKLDGPATSPAQTAGAAAISAGNPAGLRTFAMVLPDAATGNYDFTVPFACEIVDVWALKDGAGAANTVQLFKGTASAITTALAFAVDLTITRATTLGNRTLAAGGAVRVTNTRAAGSSAGTLFVSVIPR